MTTVPKVIHLVISLDHGGLERLVVDWTNARNRRHPGSTMICCLDKLGELAGQVEGGNVMCLDALRSRRPFDLAAVRRLRKQLSSCSCVLHTHNAAAWQYGVLACLGTGIRHIHTEHGTNPHSGGLVNRLRNAFLWRMTDEIVVVAESVAQQVSSGLGIPRSRLKVIPNGIREEGFRVQGSGFKGRRELGIPEGARVIGSVGRLAAVKGYDRLLTAFSRMSRELTLLLVGDGPQRGVLERHARDLGIADRVIFAGYQADPWPYYAAMDLFALPSRSEGLSISLLEAMVAGVPVAVTDAGANREVVDQGRAGLILPEEEGQWPALLSALLADPATAHRVTIAKERVRALYSLETTLSGYEALYKK